MQEFFGSPTWTRTRDLRINSPSLYQLSYQGIDKAAILLTVGSPVNRQIRFHAACRVVNCLTLLRRALMIFLESSECHGDAADGALQIFHRGGEGQTDITLAAEG